MKAVALAAVVLAVSIGLAYGGASWMEASSPEDDACIGCGIVLLGGIGFGVSAAAVILLVGWLKHRTARDPQPRPTP